MYINVWYAMAESHQVVAGEPFAVRALGQSFVLFRDQQGQLSCLHDVCSHRGGSLSAGTANAMGFVPIHGHRPFSGMITFRPPDDMEKPIMS